MTGYLKMNKNDISNIKGNIKFTEYDSFLKQLKDLVVEKPKKASNKLSPVKSRLKKTMTRANGQRLPPLIDHFKFNNHSGLKKCQNRIFGMALVTQNQKRMMKSKTSLKLSERPPNGNFRKKYKRKPSQIRMAKFRTNLTKYTKSPSRYKILYDKKRRNSGLSKEEKEFN